MALELVSAPSGDAVADLERFDLSVAEVHDQVLARSIDAARAVSSLAPRSFRGQTRNAVAVIGLRELLLGRGWESDDDQGVARVIHRERGISVVVVTGNPATGQPTARGGRGPSNKWPRGPLTREAIEDNGELALFEMAGSAADATTTPLLQTWFLLMHADKTEVRVELSRPDHFTDRFVDHWGKRIILPALPTGAPGDDLDTDDDGDIPDVPVLPL